MRPEILFPFFASITTLSGVGPRVAPLLEKVAGPLVRDVAFLMPQSLLRRRPCTIADARPDELVILDVLIENHVKPGGARQPYKIRAFDGSGFLYLTFFRSHGPHLQKQFPIGERRIVSGKFEQFGSEFQISHPEYVVLPTKVSDIPQIEPVYAATAGLSSRMIRRFVNEAADKVSQLPEWQDRAWLQRQGFPSWKDALSLVHNPKSEADLLESTPARQRLAFDEFLAHQMALTRRRAQFQRQSASTFPHSELARTLQSRLPWRLTQAQQRALAEISGDLGSGRRMSRLLQGDVGSGKTVVAMLAVADVAASGSQSAVMAPTEILARQHFESLAPGLAEVGVSSILLTGRDKGNQRSDKLAMIASGQAKLVVGTHALFQEDVVYESLALTIVDEQHRFGVSDRHRLQIKGDAVHFLAMSATPIPRTLELTQFGDLDVSRIDEKPPGRSPVVTRMVSNERIDDVISRLITVVSEGAQAFWICPLVAENETLDVTAAESRAASLAKVLPDQVGLVHGRMPSAQKDAVMLAFQEGRLGVLVATTVVEVGVNVPNASIMVIEHAERFGLSQLHQLRGRVGRGTRESACLLLYQPPLTVNGQARLDILRRSDDGFELAEKDLELRGGGDPLGLRQSGFPAYRFADVIAHRNLMLAASDDARLIQSRDPDLSQPRGQALRVLQALFDWRESSPLNDAG
jgi:ATP-dependent DNA helicase RecG